MTVLEKSSKNETPVPARRSRLDHPLAVLFERYALVILLVVVVVFFSVYSTTAEIFPSRANLDNVLGNQSVAALAAIATVMPLIGGQFDLSVGATLGISALVTAKALSDWQLPLGVALLIGLAVGGAIGVVNGFAVAALGVNSLIMTLAISTVLAGLSTWISATPIVSGIPTSLTDFGSGDWMSLPRLLFVLVGVALVALYLLEHTPLGRELYAIGSNRAASRLIGVQVERKIFGSFVASGLIAGLAGVLQLARSGSGDPAVGAGFTLPAIAAAFLGATAIRPGRFNVLGTLVAVFFLAAVVSGLTISGAQSWLQDVVNGVALALGIVISTFIARQRSRES
jgi:ribose transport system permease protein